MLSFSQKKKKKFYLNYTKHCFSTTDSGVSEGLVLTSDSENEIFCDSLDTVEQLGSIKVQHPIGRNDAVSLACIVLLQGLRHATTVQMNKGIQPSIRTKMISVCSLHLSVPMVSIMATHWSRPHARSHCWIAIGSSDRWERVRVEKGRRMGRVTVPAGGVETPAGEDPTTTGETVSHFKSYIVRTIWGREGIYAA